MFIMHPRLAADTIEITSWKLSRVRLMKDANYPWLVLVPARDGITGIHQLPTTEAATLMTEISRASRALEELYRPSRINVAALGNMVPQLHVHVIARFENDPAWPGPVWGALPDQDYPDDDLQRTIATLGRALE